MKNKLKGTLSVVFTFIAMIIIYINADASIGLLRYITLIIAIIALVLILITLVKK